MFSATKTVASEDKTDNASKTEDHDSDRMGEITQIEENYVTPDVASGKEIAKEDSETDPDSVGMGKIDVVEENYVTPDVVSRKEFPNDSEFYISDISS